MLMHYVVEVNGCEAEDYKGNEADWEKQINKENKHKKEIKQKKQGKLLLCYQYKIYKNILIFREKLNNYVTI